MDTFDEQHAVRAAVQRLELVSPTEQHENDVQFCCKKNVELKSETGEKVEKKRESKNKKIRSVDTIKASSIVLGIQFDCGMVLFPCSRFSLTTGKAIQISQSGDAVHFFPFPVIGASC